mmetsp:Transcript_42294/g.62735  ORF Transcript_42294/g.62735 Transcript_42294/m.62735 type:complete len:101 (-) Transcript_42294:239-541(-)
MPRILSRQQYPSRKRKAMSSLVHSSGFRSNAHSTGSDSTGLTRSCQSRRDLAGIRPAGSLDEKEVVKSHAHYREASTDWGQYVDVAVESRPRPTFYGSFR